MPVSSADPGLPVPSDLQRGFHQTRQEWIDSGVFAVELLSRTLGRADLDGVELLDVGCGTKIVKTLLDRAEPIGRYVGIDACLPVVEWLDENVVDPRFAFRHFDAHNDLYNPDGVPMAAFDRLPVGADPFDLICLFSVFTHLAPDDYLAMLRLTRQHIKPDGTLLFSLFLNDEEMPSPVNRALDANLASDDPAVAEAARAAIEEALETKQGGFIDEVPETPLLRARYDRDLAVKLVDGTGWEMVRINEPSRFIQHQFVCQPI